MISYDSSKFYERSFKQSLISIPRRLRQSSNVNEINFPIRVMTPDSLLAQRSRQQLLGAARFKSQVSNTVWCPVFLGYDIVENYHEDVRVKVKRTDGQDM